MGSRATVVPGDPHFFTALLDGVPGHNGPWGPTFFHGSLLDGVPGHNGPWDPLGPTWDPHGTHMGPMLDPSWSNMGPMLDQLGCNMVGTQRGLGGQSEVPMLDVKEASREGCYPGVASMAIGSGYTGRKEGRVLYVKHEEKR